MKPILRMHGVSKRYGREDEPVVSGIDLDLEAGEILALLGPSGCGKTTTLRLIAGFEKPEKGSIVLEDRVLCDDAQWVRPEERGIGFVFQDYALFPHLNVAQNIAFGLRHLSRRQRNERVDQAIELAGLTGLAKRAPHELSGGQQQRVALARSMSPGPKVILMDEPFSNLDASLRVDTRNEVSDILKRSGMSAILVTHDQEEALTVADRIAVMNDGRVEQCGTPIDIYRNPTTSFVAQFLGITNLVNADAQGACAHCALGCVDINTESSGDILLSVRPEQLAIEISSSGEGMLGVVLNREFKGHDQFYDVQVDTETFVVMTDHRSTFESGDRVHLRMTEPAVVVNRN
ncbi:MAG TPA: ABC transporter ATP-binding protein [Candidatus Hydrogenedentes bacterium]|nr:ABC transporter ATP-binding protein [Candidatus Hydrogenedentota bacterium]